MTELLLAGGGALIGCLLAVLGAGGSILLLPLLGLLAWFLFGPKSVK